MSVALYVPTRGTQHAHGQRAITCTPQIATAQASQTAAVAPRLPVVSTTTTATFTCTGVLVGVYNVQAAVVSSVTGGSTVRRDAPAPVNIVEVSVADCPADEPLVACCCHHQPDCANLTLKQQAESSVQLTKSEHV